MHKLINNFYIKSLIRAIKEHGCYNNIIKTEIDERIFKRITSNDSNKYVYRRFYPHILLNEIESAYHKYTPIFDLYKKLILNKFIDDVLIIIRENSSVTIDEEELYENIKRKRLYWFLENNCKISSTIIDSCNKIFYPEINRKK